MNVFFFKCPQIVWAYTKEQVGELHFVLRREVARFELILSFPSTACFPRNPKAPIRAVQL